MKTGVAMLAVVLLAPAAFGARLINLSSRGPAGAGAEALTVGFVVRGDGPKKLLVRAAGPALAAFGVGGALAEPKLELFQAATLLASNTRWDAGADAAAVAQAARTTGAFAFAAGANDAALLIALAPGNYTALVSPARSGVAAGIALIEVYDAEPATASQLVNLSTRGRVGLTPETALIAGFVVGGEGASRLLVRGAGPGLTAFGVAGALANPQLEVFRDGASAGYNDDWQINADATLLATVARGVGAFEFANGSRDAALVLAPLAGASTVQVSGVGGTGGLALAEIYDAAAVSTLPPARNFDLVGFGRVAGHGLAALTGGGGPTTNYDPVARTGNFWRIDEATIAAAGFAAQFQAACSSDQPLVIELNVLLDLSRFGRPNNGATAIAHPDLFAAGRTTGTVGILTLGSNKTIYSALGNGGFRRGSLSISGKGNIMLRNLRFRELWEWDDATRGDYDRNDWDYINVTSATSGANVTARAHHIWIDHCDFEKSYDGLFDFVHGSDLITVSWCRVGGATSGESMRWVQRQLDYLEANRARFPYYDAQRAGSSPAEVLRKETFQKKSNLVGNGTDASTQAHDLGYLNVTFHHNHYLAIDQRMPRLRYGNAHVFNLLADSSAGRGVSGLSLMGVAATSGGAIRLENSWFIDARAAVTIVAGTEPVGVITAVGSTNFDSVTRIDKGFDATIVTPVARFGWNQPATATGLGAWPVADTAIMPAGYVPAGRTLAEYRDTADWLGAHVSEAGVVVPADAEETERLRARWQVTTAVR